MLRRRRRSKFERYYDKVVQIFIILWYCSSDDDDEEESVQLLLFEGCVDLLSVPGTQHPIKGIRDAIKKVHNDTCSTLCHAAVWIGWGAMKTSQ